MALFIQRLQFWSLRTVPGPSGEIMVSNRERRMQYTGNNKAYVSFLQNANSITSHLLLKPAY